MGQAMHRSTPGSGQFYRGAQGGRRLQRPAVIIAGAIAAVAIGGALLGDHGIPAFLKLRTERQALEADVESLKNREASLAADIEALASDPETVERVARERYRWHKPGETVIEVIGGPENETADNPPPSP